MTSSSQQAVALLADLAILGISVRVDGQVLRVGPRAKVTSAISRRLKDLKPEVLAVLCGQASRAKEDDTSPVGRQAHCRFAVTQQELRRRGFHVLADKPEFVLAVLAAVEVLVEEMGVGNDG